VGNKKWLQRTGIEIPDKLELASELWLNQAFTVFWFSEDNKAIACIAIADSIKDTSAAAVKKMQSLGLDIWMLTGDNVKTATAIARQCGIKNFKAELLPDEKVNFVKDLQNNNQYVAMVGDGINDSPALAQADLSIAMGKGSDIAMNIAQMTIINNDLINVPEAINIAKLTTATIRQNLFWAFIYNIIGIPLAAGLFYPFSGLLLNPMWAGMAMAMSSVSVVSNSLRLKFKN
jgi:Cu2+-exporting ATPase